MSAATQNAVAAPKVWLDLDQAALDAAYDQVRWSPGMARVLARYAARSRAVRTAIGEPTRLAYGDSEVERFDLYRANSVDPAPVVFFVHGGAWRSGRAADYAFFAEWLHAAGVHVAIPDFSPVTDHAGDLRVPAAQVARAYATVLAQAASFGGDPGRVHVVGHSSGAHFASVLLTAGAVAASAMLVSGIYDLRPVRLSKRNSYLSIDDEAEQALSAVRNVSRLRTALDVLIGTDESPEFLRQGRSLADAVGAGRPVTCTEVEGYDHFELLETLADPYGALGRRLRRALGVGDPWS